MNFRSPVARLSADLQSLNGTSITITPEMTVSLPAVRTTMS